MSQTVQIGGHTVWLDGKGSQTIVMLHGWPDTPRLWDAQVQLLAPHWCCVRVALPGYAEGSARQAASLDQVVDLLRQVVQHTSADRPVTLLLHDWGCLFGYQFAMLNPGLVSRIIGVDIGDARSVAHLQSLRPSQKAIVAAYQLWLALAWRLRWVRKGRLGDRMTRAMARWLRCPTDPATIHVGMCYPYDIAWTGSYGGYGSVKAFDPPCPMLYIYGTRKPFMFHSQAWLAQLQARPGSRAVGLRTGHWVMCQQPEEFNHALLDWLAPPVPLHGPTA